LRGIGSEKQGEEKEDNVNYCYVVSVPLRGIGSEKQYQGAVIIDCKGLGGVSVPLRGIGSEKQELVQIAAVAIAGVSVPLRGIGSEKQFLNLESINPTTWGFRPLAGNRF